MNLHERDLEHGFYFLLQLIWRLQVCVLMLAGHYSAAITMASQRTQTPPDRKRKSFSFELCADKIALRACRHTSFEEPIDLSAIILKENGKRSIRKNCFQEIFDLAFFLLSLIVSWAWAILLFFIVGGHMKCSISIDRQQEKNESAFSLTLMSRLVKKKRKSRSKERSKVSWCRWHARTCQETIVRTADFSSFN